jgi:hypothetical protein
LRHRALVVSGQLAAPRATAHDESTICQENRFLTFTEAFCISQTGSTRASAYNWGNKILSIQGKTHIVWLDTVATVCGRTFDHDSEQWGEIVRIDEGSDNHTNPCITADAEGRIRLTYGPHGWSQDWNQGRVKWRLADRPGQLETWEREENFGYNATAASIVNTPSGLDAVVCRGGESPAQTVFHRQRAEGGFTSAKPLFCQDIEPQYTHHYGHITCGTDGTLYTACHFYNVGGGDNAPVTGDTSRMRSYGAAVLRSTDFGDTWTDLSGDAVTTPTLYEHHVAIPPLDRDVYINSITLDTTGTVWALTMNPRMADDRVWLNKWTGQDWQTVQLESYLPSDRMAVEGMMTIDTRNRLHIVITALQPADIEGGSHWGHRSSEVFYLHSDDDGQTFHCQQLSESDTSSPNWLPSISRPGPFHPVETPTLTYTHGGPGEGLRPDTQTEVWCVRLLDDLPE